MRKIYAVSLVILLTWLNALHAQVRPQGEWIHLSEKLGAIILKETPRVQEIGGKKIQTAHGKLKLQYYVMHNGQWYAVEQPTVSPQFKPRLIQAETHKPPQDSRIEIVVKPNSILLNDNHLTEEAFSSLLGELPPNSTFLIKAQNNLPFKEVSDVFESISQAGFRDILFSTYERE